MTIETYASAIEALSRRIKAWTRAHPDENVKIQFNNPGTVWVAGTISDSIDAHFVSCNAAGLAMLKDTCNWGTTDEMSMMMVKMALDL